MAVTPTDYPELFRSYAVRSAQVTLARVRAHASSFADAPHQQIFQALDFAMPLKEAWPWVKDVLLTIAPQMVRAGYQNGWAPYLVRGIELAQNWDDDVTAAELQLNLGWLLQLRGDFDSAAAHYAASLAVFEAVENRSGTGRTLSRQAFIACMRQDFDQAEALAERALLLFDADDPERATALNALGRVAYLRQDFVLAISRIEEALRWRKSSGDRFHEADNLRDLGNALWRLNRLDEARTCFEEGAAIYLSHQSQLNASSMLVNLGNLYCETNQFDEALRRYEEAHRVYAEWGEVFRLAIVTLNIGYALIKLEKYHLAKSKFIAALRYLRTVHNQYMQAVSLRYLGDTHLKLKHRQRAQAAYRYALAIIETLESSPDVEEHKKALLTELAGMK